MPQETQLVATITATDKSTLDDDLNRAVEAAQKIASGQGRIGILVTRFGFSSFTVELSPEVPYGLTLERHIP